MELPQQFSVAETPPALRSLHSEVRRLQAALDAERFDRNYLQDELTRTNARLERLCHVDPGESDWITALRETREEAGLFENDLEIYKDISKILNYEVQGKPKVVVYWLAKLKNPDQEVKLSDEHQDLKWLSLHQAQEISGYEDMKNLLEEFEQRANELI